ncbi:hypothetical protein [Streptomyces sp. NPDC091217]
MTGSAFAGFDGFHGFRSVRTPGHRRATRLTACGNPGKDRP